MPADIRTARASDVDDLAAIENAVFAGDRISRNSFRRLISSDTAAMLLLQEAQALAGYCAILFRTGSRKARLYSIAAAPGVSGIGRRLLEAAETETIARGRDRLGLEVRADNARAISLYERSGYVRIGEVAGYYADGATALRYEKHLHPARPLDPGHAPTGTRAS